MKIFLTSIAIISAFVVVGVAVAVFALYRM